MTKKELIDQIAVDAEITKKEAETALESVLKGIETSLLEDGKITFVGFGTFEVRERAAREGVNPRDPKGPKIQIAASKSVGFKAGKILKDKLN